MKILEFIYDLTGSIFITWLISLVLICLVFYLIKRLTTGIYDFFAYELSIKDAESLNVTKIQFIREIVDWCVENLGLASNSNHPPSVELMYYKHSKLSGVYYTNGKRIIVYWGSHQNLLDIIDTTIHEYQHYLDLKNMKDVKAYDKESEDVGYFENYYEVRARKVAAKHRVACFKYLKKQQIIL
ncbi:hypothetical protein [Mongoliitalea lutea]|uniref:Uncharacterized protein n=1 Tax=Mongoliitalea lutea TaxID=849756 RepID=A0A8J3G6U7_9BACT|nr:hypothetical protein [Mongoliitalea lutea]GHB49242.1 hypothetical protein GCM10008106_32560 [Mongoliitalea lutea]